MCPRSEKHRPIVLSHIINHDPNSQHVIVGVRIKRPILMPLNRRTALFAFQIQLTVL